jgi:alcohol dehydrogenase
VLQEPTDAIVRIRTSTVRSGRLQPRKLVTHRFALEDVMQAYDAFEQAAKTRALKVILSNDTHG